MQRWSETVRRSSQLCVYPKRFIFSLLRFRISSHHPEAGNQPTCSSFFSSAKYSSIFRADLLEGRNNLSIYSETPMLYGIIAKKPRQIS